MKKMILCFAAILFISVSANAQKTQEEVRVELAKGMVSFVNGVKGGYAPGKSYVDFKKTVCGPWSPVAEGEDLLKQAYQYISSNTSSTEILNKYDGQEMAAAILFLDKNPRSDGAELFGGVTGQPNQYATQSTGGCKWYQIGCHLGNFWNWLTANDNANLMTIITIITFIAAL